MFYVPDVLAEWEMACRMQHGMQALSFLQEKGKKLWRTADSESPTQPT